MITDKQCVIAEVTEEYVKPEDLTDGCKHMPPMTDDFRGWHADRVTAFLSNTASAASA